MRILLLPFLLFSLFVAPLSVRAEEPADSIQAVIESQSAEIEQMEAWLARRESN